MANRAGGLAKGFIEELDGLRGIAILIVMVHRFWPETGPGVAGDVAGAGWIGVDLFFVVSGFLITGILLDTKGEPGYLANFYARRVLRIFPLYYLFVLGTFAAFSHNGEFGRAAGSPFWYVTHLGNVPEGLLGNDPPYWLGCVWSLAIEEQFYLTFPWLVLLLSRRRLTIVLISMMVAAPAIRLGTTLAWPDHERVQYLFTLCRIDTIAAGCLLAVLVRSPRVERWRENMKLVAVGVVPGAAILALGSHLDRTSLFDRVLGYSAVAAGCASIVTLVVLARGSWETAPLRYRPLCYLGKLCFGLYLLHRPADTIVSGVADRVGVHGDLWLMVPKLGMAVLLATLSWRYFEQPFLQLKDRFATARHPSALSITLLVLVLISGCGVRLLDTDPPRIDAATDSIVVDLPMVDAMADAIADTPDTSVPTYAPILYLEGTRHSPITPAVVARLQGIVSVTQGANVFAKIGDSITVDPNFLACFDGGIVDFGAQSGLAPTVAYFMAGNAAGASPFARVSLAAKGGTTAYDAIRGNPCPLEQELSAVVPSIEVIMFGTNEVRYGWTLDEFATYLWNAIDESIARGVVPIMSTIPPNTGYPEADARIPTFNRMIRAIAQGRGVPLVDFHRELELLPSRGISGDRLHPSVSPNGGCTLTADGLQYGYNVRNLITLEALARVRAALAGSASDAAASTRVGTGTEADPFAGQWPLVDLGDTRSGSAYVDHDCGTSTGNEVAYRVVVASPTTIRASVVDRPGTDVELRIVAGGICVASGDATATATVPAGPADVLVTSRNGSTEGEFLLVIE